MSPDVSCRELVEFLDEYLAGGLSAEQVFAFNSHLSACPACVAYMKTYRQSADWARAALLEPRGAAEVPEELLQAILAARGKP